MKKSMIRICLFSAIEKESPLIEIDGLVISSEGEYAHEFIHAPWYKGFKIFPGWEGYLIFLLAHKTEDIWACCEVYSVNDGNWAYILPAETTEGWLVFHGDIMRFLSKVEDVQTVEELSLLVDQCVLDSGHWKE